MSKRWCERHDAENAPFSKIPILGMPIHF
jgi:hypothetical protein